MGNVESRPINRPVIEVSHKSARPLPPLPDDEIDEYDLDSPPPYPPPPPPHEENGGKSKRVSWKFREPNFFGGLKRGSWVLQPHSESDAAYKYHDTKKGTPTFTGKNISNTIATEDNNVVTVSVIGTPDKDDVIKSHNNDSTTVDGSQNSWAVKNMQLILNSEMQTGDISSSSNKKNISDSNKVELSLESKNYPYPDVQTYSENEVSSLPDVVKTRKLDTSNETNISITKETVHLKRVEDIRLDYPEGNAREVSNYNTLEYNKEDTSIQPLNLQVEGDGGLDVSVGRSSADVKNYSKSKKGKLPSCFGRKKTDDISDEEFDETAFSIEKERSGASSPESKTLSLTPSSELNLNVSPVSSTPKKAKKTKIGSCFSKSPSKDEIDGPLSTSTPDIDSRLNLRASGSIDGSSDRVEYITPKLEAECDIDTSLRKDAKSPKKPKSNLGSCFGKEKSGKLEKPSEKGELDIKADNKSSITVEKSVPESDLSAEIKTKKSKKSPLTACFGKDSKNKYEITNASQEFEIKTEHDDVVRKVNVQPPELEIQKENLSKNINIDNELEITSPSADFEIRPPKANISFEGPSIKTDLDTKPEIDMEKFNINSNIDNELEIISPSADFEIRPPKANISFEGPSIKTDLDTKPEIDVEKFNINSELTAKFPEKYSQSTDFDFPPSKNINIDLQTSKVEIKQPTLEIESPKLKLGDLDIEDNNLALKFNTNLKDEDTEWKSKDINISYSPTLEFKDNNFNSDQKLEIIPPCVDLRIEPDIAGEEIKYKPIDDKQLEISLKPQPINIKGSVDVPSADIELQKNEELKLEIPSLIVKEPKQSFDLPNLDLEIDPSKKDDINFGKIDVDLVTPKIEPHFNEQPKKIDKPKKPKAKFGSCFGKSKPDGDMSVQSPEVEGEGKVKASSVDVSPPSVEVKGSVASAEDAKLKGDIELSSPKIEASAPKGSGKGKFKLGSCLGKDKSKSVKTDKPEAKVTIPEGGIKGSVEVDTPKIEGNVNIGKENIDVKGPKVDGKGKLGLGSCFGKSKTPKVETEVDIPESDISGLSAPDRLVEADAKLKSPELDIKGDVSTPVIKSEIDVDTPELKIDGKKKKSSLGSCFGKPKSTDVEKKPSTETKVEIKGPSIEGEMNVEGKLPSGEIPSKKKKGNLGSCFGKKDKSKLKADIDIKPPKSELSAETPSVNIESSVPDITLDPSINVGNVDLDINRDKPEVSVEISSVTVEGNIPKPSLEVDASSIPFKSPEIDLNVPKYEIGIEGKSPDMSVSPKVDLDIKSPDLDFKGDTEFSIECPKLPSTEMDLDISTSDMKVPKIKGEFDGEVPKFDPKFDIDIDTGFSKVDIDARTPGISLEKESSLKVPTPDIEVDISGNIPDVELGGDIKVDTSAADVKVPEIKGKKVKSKMPSCFGKGDKVKKDEAYIPSCEGEISVKTPDVTGKVDVESPSFEGDASIRGPDIEVKPKKSKGKLGSCFGKPKSPKAPKVEGKLSSSVEGELPRLKGEIDVDTSIEAPSVDVAAPSGELSLNVDSPQISADIKGEDPNLKVKAGIKKPKTKFGSCFGKSKADTDIKSPEIEGDMKVTTPSFDIASPSLEVEGSVDVPSAQIDDPKLKGDVELRGPKVEAEMPKGSGKGKFKFGSCLGKDKNKSVKIEKPKTNVTVPESGIKGSVKVDAPKIEGDVKIGKENIDVKGPEVNGKGKLGLGSCFGKSKTPKLKTEMNVPEAEISGPHTGGTVDADIMLKKPELEIKSDIDSPVIKSDIDIETPEIKIEGKKKNKKGSLGSCFGKSKSTDVKKNKPSLEVEGEIKGVPSIEGEMKVEGKLPSGDISPKKKKVNLGSCFGKKDKPKLKADIDIEPPRAEISSEIPSVNIEANIPEVTLDPNIKIGTIDLDINKDKPEMSVELPSVNVEGNMPEASLDVDVPSISLKSPDLDLDFPKYEIELENKNTDISLAPNVDLEVKSPDLDLKGDADFSIEGPKLPSTELDLGISGKDINVPKIEGKVEGELPTFDPKFDIDTSFPKVEMDVEAPELSLQKEGSIKVSTPDIEVDISGNIPDVELGGDIKVDTPSVDVKGPNIKGKKVKSKMPSCFGKGEKDKKGDAYMPSCEGEVSVKTPDVTGKIDVESPSFEGDSSLRGPEIKVEPKKSKGKLGSCFGKPKSPKVPKVEGKLSSSVEGELPRLEGEIDAPKGEIKIKADKPSKKSGSGFGSCFGKKTKVDGSIETPKVDVAGPSGEMSLDVDSPHMKSDIKLGEPNLTVKAEAKKPKSKFGSCFGKPKTDVDMNVSSPEIEGDMKVKTPRLDIASPSVEVEGSVDVPPVQIDDAELKGDLELQGPKVEVKTSKGSGKGKFKLGSCFGKDKDKSVKVEKPKAEVTIPEGGIKGSVEVDTPEIEGDVKIGKENIDVKNQKIDGKGKVRLGSCFGKSKAPKLKTEVNVPEAEISGPSHTGGTVDADIMLKKPELEIKSDIDSPVIKSDIDLETPEIKIEGKKKKKGSLGSCFGKSKSTDVKKKKPSLEVEGEIKGVPSIEGEMKVEGKLPSGDISPKKKKVNLGSCFGKKDKPKLKADIDIEPPRAEISSEIPSVNIEANIPEVTLDPNIKIGTIDLDINKDKPEMSVELPSVNVEGNMPEASLDVDVPSISLKSPDLDLDFPKYEIELENKNTDISLAPNVDLEVKSPDLDLKGDADFSIEGPKLPSTELDLGISGKDINVPKIEGKVEGELPTFDPKFDIDTSFPKVEMDVEAPELSLQKEGSIKVSTPDIEVDISGNVPDVELGGDIKVDTPSVDVKGPNIKGKKVKSKMPSCFGKGEKDKKGDAYMPSCEGEVSVKTPDVTGKIDVESPSFEGDSSLRGPEIKVEPKKSKGKLGSCFGKPKSPKVPKVEGKLSSSVEGELPRLEGKIDAPKGEIKIKADKPSKKSGSGFGSCFGKKTKVDGSIETPKVDVAGPSGEMSLDVDSPHMKSDIKVGEPNLNVKAEAKKPKSKFGSCFGKPKPDVDMSVPSPEIEGDMKVKTPRLDVASPSVEVEGSVDVPSAQIDDAELKGDLELHGPKVEVKTPKGSGKGKFKLGSCFGKDKDKSVKVEKPKAEVTIPEGGIKGSVEVDTPEIEGDVKIGKENIDVKNQKIDGKGKVRLGSCFGKSKAPKLKTEVNVPEAEISGPSHTGGTVDADIMLKKPELEIKSDIDSPVIKSDIDIETPEIKIEGKKKKKGSLGSCFGKSKSTDVKKKKPSLEVEGEIKGVPSIEGEMKVEGKLPSGDISPKKKKVNLGSCFGKKDKPKLKADIDIEPPRAEISSEIPSVNIEANIPEVTLDPNIKVGTIDLDINKDKPEMSVELPSVNVEGNMPEASLDVDVPSISLKSPDLDLDFPKYEIELENKNTDISLAPNVDLEVKSPDLDLKGDAEFSIEGPKLPSTELDLGISGKDINVPKIEGKVEGELPTFDPKFDIDTSFPKVEMDVEAPELSLQKEGSIKVSTPDIEVDISGNVPDVELGGDIKVDTPSVDVKGPNIKGKKVKSKMPSCFGKGEKDKKGDAYMPSCEGEVSVKTPDVTGKIDVESPSFEGDSSLRGPEIKVESKKSKGKLGSCFGKPKSPKVPKVEGKLSSSVEGELPRLEGKIDAPKGEVKIKADKPSKKSGSGFGSCFGKKTKVDGSIETPKVDVAGPSGEMSLDVDSPQMKSDIKVGEPNLNVKAEVKKPKSKFGSCFGKPKPDVDMSSPSPEIEGDVKVKTPRLDVASPSVEVEGSVDVPSAQIDDVELKGDLELRGPKVEVKTPKGSGKGKLKLGSCFGKDKNKSVKVDQPKKDAAIPESSIKGSVEVETPKIEGDVKIEKENIDIKGSKPDGKGKLGLGSCFGKGKAPKLKTDLDVPEYDISGSSSCGKLDTDVKIKDNELNIEGDINTPVIKKDIDVESPDIKIDGKKKNKGSLGSCFGKPKSLEVEKKTPSLEVEGEIKGPSIEGEMRAEGKLPSGEISSKNKTLNLGSCFGKKDKSKLKTNIDIEPPKPKLKTDIDFEPPNAEFSAEIPSVNVETNVPEVTLDPKITVGTVDLDINKDKPEVSVGLPSVNFERNIPEASLGEDTPSISLKAPDIDLDFPKYEIGIEGKSTDMSVSPDVDLDIKSPDLDFKGDTEFSVEGPKLPNAELDLDIISSDIKLPKIESEFEGKVPKFDPKFDIDIDTGFSKVNIDAEAPDISLEKESSLKIPTPDIEVDISGNIPDVELGGDIKVDTSAADVKVPKVKGKKVKSKMPSCFGKGDKVKKDEAYIPSCEGEISVKTPDVTGKVDVESPSFEGDASIRGPDIEVKPKKSKGKLGSCFGKPKSPKAPKVEGKLSSSVEGELPRLKGEIDVDTSIEGPSVDVAAPSGELSVKVDSPQIKTDIIGDPNLEVNPEIKKPKTKFGSCFGKSKADTDLSVKSPEIEGNVKVTTPSLGIDSPTLGVEGSVDVPSVQIDDVELKGDVELRDPKVEAETPKGSGKGKFKFGSCLGKDKSKSVKIDKPEAKVTVPESGIKGSVEVDTPKIEGDVNIGKENIDVKGTKVDSKGNLGLGSCFGKSKTPKVKSEVDVPHLDISGPSAGKLDAEININDPELDIKSDINSPVIKSDIDVETPEVKMDSKKKKSTLGSCFGKRKSLDIEQKNPPVEVEGEIKGVPVVKGEMNVEGDIPSGEINSKKKKVNLGSCFGKKDKLNLKADIDVKPSNSELSTEIPSVNIEGKIPGKTFDSNVKVNKDKPDVSVDFPSINVKGNVPEASLDVDAPSISFKSPNIDLDSPKYEIGIEGKSPDISMSPNVDLGMKSPDLDLKGDANFSVEGSKLPSAELDLDVSDRETNIPMIEGKIERELEKFDPKLDININTSFPKVETEVTDPKISIEKQGSLKVSTPPVEVDISSGVPDIELEGDVKVETPNVDVKGPKMKGKKIKSKMPSCFGKNDKDSENSYTLTSESNVNVNGVHSFDADVSLPSVECNGSPLESGARNKKKRINFGSCLGKKSDTDLEFDKNFESPEMSVSSDISKPKETKIFHGSGDLDFSVNGFHNFDVPSQEQNTLSKGFPQVTVTSNFKNDTKVETNGINGDFSVELPMANVDTACPESQFIKNYEDKDNEIRDSLRFPDVIAVGGNGISADLSTGTKREKPYEGINFENDFSEDILARCSFNIPISESDKGYRADIPVRFSGDQSQIYENVSRSSTGKDHSPDIKVVEFDITSNAQKIEPSHSVETVSPDLKVHFLDDNDSSGPAHPVYCNVDSKLDVNIPTYENISITSPHILPQHEPSIDTEFSEVPKPPKRWYGIDGTTVEGTVNVPDVDIKTDFVLKNNETDIPQGIPLEAKSDFQSIQFVRQMVEAEERKREDESKLGKVSFASDKPEVTDQFHTNLKTSDLLAQKLEEFDKNNFDSQPIVKRTIKVKTFKIKEGSDEPEEVIEEFEAEGEELECDAEKLFSEKLAKLRLGLSDSQPEIKRTVRIKTFKTKEGSDEPEELIEEFVNESKIPLDSSAMFKASFDEKDKRGAKYFDIKDEEHTGRFDTSDLLIKKLADFDMDSSRPVVKRTVKVKTYSTKDGDDDSEEIVEEFEGNEDSSLGKSEATKYLLKKIADFDGKGISGEPFVKRTVKVKTYKTKEGSDDTETIEEFEHSSSDISLSDILHDRYPELRQTKLESHDILKSLEIPNSQETISTQSSFQIGKSGELEGNMKISRDDTK